MHRSTRASLLALALAIPASPPAQQPKPPGRTPATEPVATARFTSLNHTFLIDLPADYRQLAPNEAGELERNPATPPDWRFTSPHSFYAIGPVDRWLAGDFATPWLYVTEQEGEWHVEGDFGPQIVERWRQNGEARGVRHEVTGVHRVEIGPQAHGAWRASRTTTLADGRRIRSLDVYASTGGRQVTLTLRAWEAEFARQAPAFERWLSTLTFARRSRGEQTLTDRLWTPVLTGALVGLALLALYKHTRRGR